MAIDQVFPSFARWRTSILRAGRLCLQRHGATAPGPALGLCWRLSRLDRGVSARFGRALGDLARLEWAWVAATFGDTEMGIDPGAPGLLSGFPLGSAWHDALEADPRFDLALTLAEPAAENALADWRDGALLMVAPLCLAAVAHIFPRV